MSTDASGTVKHWPKTILDRQPVCHVMISGHLVDLMYLVPVHRFGTGSNPETVPVYRFGTESNPETVPMYRIGTESNPDHKIDE